MGVLEENKWYFVVDDWGIRALPSILLFTWQPKVRENSISIDFHLIDSWLKSDISAIHNI